MNRAVILSPVDRDFAKDANFLAREGKKLAEAHTHLTERMLVFAQDFKRLWDRANTLDHGETGRHHNHLREALAEAIETSNKSIRSHWITIGAQAKKLIPHKDALPPYRDTLYEIALAIKEDKPVTQWFKQKQITVDSSVREVRSLRVGSRRRARNASNKKPSNKLKRSYPATISLSFETYTAAAEVLSQLLSSSKADFRLTAPQSFDDALQEQLNDHDYQKATNRFGKG
jgi:hypothetical protein